MAWRTYLQNGLWSLTGNVVARALSLLTLGALARLLSPALFGTYTLLTATADSFGQMADVGTSLVVQRTFADHARLGGNRVAARFWASLVVVLLAYGLLTAVLVGFAGAGLLPARQWVQFGALLWGIGLSAKLAQWALVPLVGLADFRRYGLRTTLGAALALAFVPTGALALGLAGSLTGLLLANVLTLAVSAGVMGQVLRRLNARCTAQQVWRAVPVVWRDGFVYYVGNTFGGALFTLVSLSLVSRYVPAGAFGYVRIGLALYTLVSIVVAAWQPVLLSALAVSGEADRHPALKSAQIRLLFPAVAGAVAWIILLSDCFIALLFGADYVVGRPVVVAMLLIGLVQLPGGLYTSFLTAAGRANWVGLISVGSLGVSAGLAAWLIPRLGLVGYLIAYGSGYVLGLVATALLEHQHEHYADARQMLCAGLLVVAGVAVAASLSGIAALALRMGLGLLSTVLGAWALWRFALRPAEQQLVRNRFSAAEHVGHP